MTEHEWPEGQKVVVREFAEDPAQGIDLATSLVEQKPPSPSALRDTDVIVRVKSVQVGWVDLLMTSGQYQHMPKPPYTPGLEYAGEVLWTGAAIPKDACPLGSQVLVDGFLAGPRSLGDYQSWGGFATYAVAPQNAVHRIPDGLSVDESCCLLGNYETAYHCLVHCGRLRKGETVLILGAAGSTGLAAVQIAKLLGATVIAVGRSKDKLAQVKALGADHIVSCRDPESPSSVRRFREDVKALTAGAGVDVVYDGVGGDVSLESLRCVKFGARFLIVGWASTPLVAQGKGGRGAPHANVLPTNLIMMKSLTVMGCPTVISTIHDPTIRSLRLQTIFDWAKSGAIRPHISHRFALAEFRQAMKAKWNGEVTGSCVIHP